MQRRYEIVTRRPIRLFGTEPVKHIVGPGAEHGVYIADGYTRSLVRHLLDQAYEAGRTEAQAEIRDALGIR